MNCAEFEDWLQRRLDGVDTSEGEAEHHRAGCPACASLHEALSRLEVGLRARPLLLPPPGLADRIVHEVVTRRRTARRLQFAVAVGALAAALLLVLVLGKQPANNGRSTDSDVVKRHEIEPAPLAVQPKLNDRVGEAGSALASLFSKTADETMKEAKLVLPERVTPSANDVAALTTPTLDPATQPLYDAGQTVSSGLEPVATQARKAVTLFWRDMPPMPVSMQ
jgi:hypothetical protein